jgi:hypothetical protein
MKKAAQSLSYHEAASLERAAILRKVRKAIAQGPLLGSEWLTELRGVEKFILGRVKRFRKRPGGL